MAYRCGLPARGVGHQPSLVTSPQAATDTTRDVVVVVPGITGFVLAGESGAEIWGLSGQALMNGLRSLGRNIDGLLLPPEVR